MILRAVCIVVVGWLAYSAVCLYRNVQRVKTIGLPYKIIPVSSLNIVWAASEPLMFGLLHRLPFKLGNLSRYGYRAWHLDDRARSFLEMGSAFAIVSPGDIFVYTCDPKAITEVFARRQEFIRPVELYQILAVYGSNVSTTPWTDWQRQRKFVSAPFNERTNKMVWSETLTQARDMLDAWTRPGASGVQGTAKDTRTLALDVLAATGFKKSYKFYASTDVNPAAEASRDYRQSLKVVMDNAIFMMIAPLKLLSLPLAPAAWRRVAQATDDFRGFMLRMLEEEHQLLREGKPGTGHLMTALVRASELSKTTDSEGVKTLTVSEMLGNLFIINFAGHDTTANVLAYAVMLLAAHPNVQDWVREELDTVLGHSNSETWEYEVLFPQLKRCFAVLLETVRLYPPVIAIPKRTGQQPTQLKIDERTYTLPPQTFVVPGLIATHSHPKFWGADALEWRPSRWIESDHSSSLTNATADRLQKERFFEPAHGTYFPWSDGPQWCPGKKFAQVEFVAVVAQLLLKHRVRPAPLQGETSQDARNRALAVCNDGEHIVLLRMRDGDSIKLIWEQVKPRR